MYLVLIPHCMTEILSKECKSGKSTVLALGTVLNKSKLTILYIHSKSVEPQSLDLDVVFEGYWYIAVMRSSWHGRHIHIINN